MFCPCPRGKLYFFLFHRFLSCAAASHPAFFVTSADILSLYSLNSAICASHLLHEKRLGCTPFHFELCFLRASPHLCKPLVLKAIAVCVSVPDLAMHPAHRCKKKSVRLFWSMSNLSKTESLSDVFLSTILSIMCVPLSSILLCLRHFLLSMTSVFPCHVFVGCRAAGHHDRLGHSDFSPAFISFPQWKQWVGPGFSTFSCLSCFFFFFSHSMPHCTTGAELPSSNFSLHCSIPVPARNLDTSSFCVEFQFLYMVNVLSKSKPGHGRETTARRQHCSEKAPGLKLGQRPQQTRVDRCHASRSDPIALVTAGIAVHRCDMRASAPCSATSKPPSWRRDGTASTQSS